MLNASAWRSASCVACSLHQDTAGATAALPAPFNNRRARERGGRCVNLARHVPPLRSAPGLATHDPPPPRVFISHKHLPEEPFALPRCILNTYRLILSSIFSSCLPKLPFNSNCRSAATLRRRPQSTFRKKSVFGVCSGSYSCRGNDTEIFM